MSIYRNLILLLICISIIWSCNTRYGYLSKVRVEKSQKQESKNKLTEPFIITDETYEIDKNVNVSNDSLPDLNCFRSSLIPKLKLNTPFKSQIQADIPSNKQAKKRIDDSARPINIFAKWSLILGIIGLFSYPLILPCLIGPVLLFASIRALKQIKDSGESGKEMAVFGFIVGVITSCLLALFVVALFVELGWLYGLILLVIAVLSNFLLFKFLNAKALYSKPIDKPHKSSIKKTSNYFIRILLGTVITASILFVIMILLTGSPIAPGVIILMSLFLVIAFNYSMKATPNIENELYTGKEKALETEKSFEKRKNIQHELINKRYRKWIIFSLLFILLAIPLFQITELVLFLILGAVLCPVLLILSKIYLNKIPKGKSSRFYKFTLFIGIVTTAMLLVILMQVMGMAIAYGII